MSKRATKKAAKWVPKAWEDVWIKATVIGGTPDDPKVCIRGYCYVEAQQSQGGLNIITVATPNQLRPTIQLFDWPGKKQPTPKGAKKK